MARGQRLKNVIRGGGARFWVELHVLGSAWVRTTLIPLPRISGTDYSLEQTTAYLPVVGILVGAIVGGAFLATDAVFGSKNLAVAFSMLVSVAITGARYEDDLASFFNLVARHWMAHTQTHDRLQTGGVALIVGLLVKYQALLLVPTKLLPSVLIAAHAFSRYAASSFVPTKRLAAMTFWGMAPVLLTGNLVVLLLMPLLWLMRNLFGAWFMRHLGGYTDVCLGATQQVVELAFYLVVIGAYVHPVTIG